MTAVGSVVQPSRLPSRNALRRGASCTASASLRPRLGARRDHAIAIRRPAAQAWVKLLPSAITPAEFILARCDELGFARAGICAAEPSAHGDHVRRWLDEGRHGEMAYLAKRAAMRLDPAKLVEGAKSIVCVADRYHDGRPDLLGRPLFGRIARYARGRDYHLVMRDRVEAIRDECRAKWPEHRFRACIDTAPLLEREHAARAQLGRVGKHTLLMEPGVGSWLLLGGVVSTMELDPTEPPPAWPDDPCGACTRCIDACPTKCIGEFTVDASACVSYLTIEHRSAIAEGFHEAIGDWLVGCDVCQEVCPHSQPTRRSKSAPRRDDHAPRRDGFDAMAILDWSEEDRARAVADTALERVSLAMLKRNAIIVAANTCPVGGREGLRARLGAMVGDAREDTMVRETARQTVARMDARS